MGDFNTEQQALQVPMDTIRSSSRYVPIRSPDEAIRNGLQSTPLDAQGRRNVLKRGPKKRGKYHGVSYYCAKKKWIACITVKDRQLHLGFHDNPITAAKIYDTWARRLHGAKATLNFP